ncbi:MAG: hypothetical protein ACI8YQ_003165 [Polaribacter sp.]|jgi:hypothetical protein
MKSTTQYLFTLLFAFTAFTTSAQVANFEETWKEFLSKEKISNISDMTKPPKNQKMDYAKYCLMYTNTYYCSGNISGAQKQMEEIRVVGEDVYTKIPGFAERHDILDINIEAYHEVNQLWNNFLKNKTVNFEALEDLSYAQKVCEKGTLAKYAYMMAYGNYCKGDLAEAKRFFNKRVMTLVEKTSLNLSDVNGLEAEVGTMKKVLAGLNALGPAWKEYLNTDVSPGFDTELPEIACNPVPSIKAYILKAAVDVCDNGTEMLEKISTLQSNSDVTLSGPLAEKLDWLKSEVKKYNGDVATLNKAWKDFIPDNELDSELDFTKEYCEKNAQIKSYIMDGTINACVIGWEKLEQVVTIWKAEKIDLDDITLAKIKGLKTKLESAKKDEENLASLWSTFVENRDTLTEKYELADFYCNNMLQVKSWAIAGHMDACTNGQSFIDKIDILQKEESLKFTDTLNCSVKHLRQKIYDCRYWELVDVARKETHAERERFGPASSKVMQLDLNSDKLPCETTVGYEALGNIGIKYTITTYLCQDIDLAKMGDPEYYKKIATWVDGEVLQKYCEKNMRCKEDFFIYLEGHTDGNPFRGARYKKSLDIPAGMAFTHFVDGEPTEAETKKEITNSLKSNMELGIARAWTVKNQLDFIGVPIHIGAYEHPKTEKGGKYRKIDIELNITKLMLDFYEKRLAQLVAAADLGERPGICE